MRGAIFGDCGSPGLTPTHAPPQVREILVVHRVARAIRVVMREGSANPNSTRLSCPVCNRIVLPLPGHSAVQALEGHLERDHWYPEQAAHDTANEAWCNNGILGTSS